MSIMELGALGEFIGSILVLGTLVYLAVQVRQGIAHSRFTTTHAIAGAGHAAWLAVAQSPELAAVMAKLETGGTTCRAGISTGLVLCDHLDALLHKRANRNTGGFDRRIDSSGVPG